MRIYLTIITLLSLNLSYCQLSDFETAYIDSLKIEIKNSKHDSTVINCWRIWDDIIYFYDPELDLELNEKIDSLCLLNLSKNLSDEEVAFYIRYRAFSLNNQGLIYDDLGKYEQSLQFYEESIVLYKKVSDSQGMAKAYNNIGTVYFTYGDHSQAITEYHKGLKISESINDSLSIAGCLGNIAIIYYNHGEYEKALDYFEQGMQMKESIGDQEGVSIALNNIGNLHRDLNEYDEAEKMYSQALAIDIELGDKYGESGSLYNLGSIFDKREESKRAIEYYNQSLALRFEIGDQHGMSVCLVGLAEIQLKKGDFNGAVKNGKKALEIAQEIGALNQIKTSSSILWRTHKERGHYKPALEMFELFVQSEDSLQSEANKNEILKQQFRYQYEKKADADSLLNAEAQKVMNAEMTAKNAELKAKKNEQYLLYGGLSLSLVFGLFIFNRFRITQKQKKIIEVQKEEVNKQRLEAEVQREIATEKNQEITDSILYAKRLQEAILPPEGLISSHLKTSFVLYKPKDIVAGDFYWFEEFAGKIYIAAADCTGHGVPGAMVSVICSNALTKALIEEGKTTPASILDRTRELVIERFGRSTEEIKDGMDISLAAINIKTREIEWAGANNPLWVIRKGGVEIEETKADKQPIGKYGVEKPFTNHDFMLNPGDQFFMFTDGYPDQFGGIKGKKYKSANFKRMLLSISEESCENQHTILLKEFEDWRGEIEQIDDVCIVGVKF